MRAHATVTFGEGGVFCVCFLGLLTFTSAMGIMGGYSSASAQEQPIKVMVSLGDVSLNKIVFIVAQEEGIYKKNGLQVEQFITPSAAENVRRSGVIVPKEYIRSGDAPISIGGGSPFIVGLTTNAQAVDRVILASTDHIVRWHVVTRPDITALEQLKGKRLGYSSYGAMTHYMALAFAKAIGWNPDQDLSLMSGALNVEALKNGRVDAIVADEVAYVMAVADGFRELVDLGKYNIPIAGSGVNATRTWLKDNRDAASRFVKSTVDAVAMLKKNKQAVFNAMAKWYNIKDPDKQEYFYKEAANLPQKPYPAVEGIRKVMEIYNYHEMRKYRPEHFYDDSFIKQLDQSGYIDGLYK